VLQIILAIILAIAKIPGIAEIIKTLVLAHTKTKEVVRKRKSKKDKKNGKENESTGRTNE